MTFLSQSCWVVGVTWKSAVCFKKTTWVEHEGRKAKGMAMNKWQGLRMDLASSYFLLLLLHVCSFSWRQEDTYCHVRNRKSEAGSKNNHQLRCLLVAPQNTWKEFLFSKQIFSHRCKRVHLHYLAQPFSISEMSQMIASVFSQRAKSRVM